MFPNAIGNWKLDVDGNFDYNYFVPRFTSVNDAPGVATAYIYGPSGSVDPILRSGFTYCLDYAMTRASNGLPVTGTINTNAAISLKVQPAVFLCGSFYRVVWTTDAPGYGYVEYSYGGQIKRIYDEKAGIVNLGSDLLVLNGNALRSVQTSGDIATQLLRNAAILTAGAIPVVFARGENELMGAAVPQLIGVSISLDSAITMNFYVAESSLVGWNEPYMVFTKDIYDAEGNVTDTVSETVSEYREGITSTGLPARIYSLHHITSVEMCSNVSATLYATADGVTGSSRTLNYSVLDYASRILPAADKAFAAVLVDLLRYGAAAQKYWGYNTANLPTAILSPAHDAIGHTEEASIAGSLSQIKNPNATVSFHSVTLSLEDRVTVNYALDLSRYRGDVTDLKLVLTYADKTVEVDELAYLPYGDTMLYVARFDQLKFSELRTLLHAEVRSKTTGEPLSAALICSAETFAASKLGDAALRPLLHAMMNLSDSAKAFFG